MLCIPRLENVITKEYIIDSFNKLKVGRIERINEIPLRNDNNYKRIIIKMKWAQTENAKLMIDKLSNNETVKVVHEFPWYWKVVLKATPS